MEKNPFSLYDFLGYLVPGAIAVFGAYFLLNLCPFNLCDGVMLNPLDIKNVIKKIPSLAALEFSWVMWLVFILFSYLIGHFIAYISSLTVEKFSNWVYGYPSDFLLNELDPFYFWKPNGVFIKSNALIWRLLISFFLLPIVAFNLVFAKLMNAKSFFVKTLDPFLIKAIQKKLGLLFFELDIDDVYDEEESDLHRIVDHYVYEKQIGHRSKLDNYVALYGFLRSITLIFNVFFWYVLYYTLFISLGELTILDAVISLFFLGGFIFIFFMAFMKFYRRYTLEGFMCLITDRA